MREPRPQRVIIRGTKALAEVDWNVTRYRSRFSTPTQVLNYLGVRHADVVVTDTFAPAGEFLQRPASQRSNSARPRSRTTRR